MSGALLGITAFLFNAGVLNLTTQTIAWCIIIFFFFFFFASAGASAAYLTVSEIFPLEVRAKAIALFFAIAQCFGAIGPILYGHLIGRSGSGLFVGYLVAAVVMIAGGLVEVFLGVEAAQKPLEEIARPLGLVRKASER
jgi:MFS family permease